jgi:hypothetical protein
MNLETKLKTPGYGVTGEAAEESCAAWIPAAAICALRRCPRWIRWHQLVEFRPVWVHGCRLEIKLAVAADTNRLKRMKMNRLPSAETSCAESQPLQLGPNG